MEKLAKWVLGAIVLIVVSVLTIAGFWIHSALAADSGACYNITDSDRRTFCLAKANKDRSYCNSIKSADIRAQCLAEVTHK